MFLYSLPWEGANLELIELFAKYRCLLDSHSGDHSKCPRGAASFSLVLSPSRSLAHLSTPSRFFQLILRTPSSQVFPPSQIVVGVSEDYHMRGYGSLVTYY